MEQRLSAAVPILRSFNEAEAKDFYLRYLGFSVVFEHRFEKDLPLYMEIIRDDCILHVSEHHGDATPGARIRIQFPNVDALQSEISARGHSRLRPGICNQPWGNRELNIKDPFGNTLTFWQPHEI